MRSMAFGRSHWTPHGGLTPEAFAKRQRYLRQFWLTIVVALIVLLAVAIVQIAQ